MFSNPEKNLKVFGLKDDSIVADLGSGNGFYATAAGKLAPRGKVYAVDVQKDHLETVKRKAQDARLKNVEIIWGNVEKPGGTKIADEVADVVIASNILFQVEDKDSFIDEAKRILKPKGKVLLSDWTDASIMRKVAVPKEHARKMFEQKGFRFDREIDTGDQHYGIILIKP